MATFSSGTLNVNINLSSANVDRQFFVGNTLNSSAYDSYQVHATQANGDTLFFNLFGSDDILSSIALPNINNFSTAFGHKEISYQATSGTVAGEIDSISVSEYGASEAPEPSTWLTMILGFGAVGYALRRSHKVAINFS